MEPSWRQKTADTAVSEMSRRDHMPLRSDARPPPPPPNLSLSSSACGRAGLLGREAGGGAQKAR
jgi:hypothetical protein